MFENKKGKIARQLFIILGLVGLIIKKWKKSGSGARESNAL
jgi:hypothetical protein